MIAEEGSYASKSIVGVPVGDETLLSSTEYDGVLVCLDRADDSYEDALELLSANTKAKVYWIDGSEIEELDDSA